VSKETSSSGTLLASAPNTFVQYCSLTRGYLVLHKLAYTTGKIHLF